MLRRLWRRLRRYLLDHGPELALAIFVAVFLVVYFRQDIFISIGPGHYGVIWRRFFGGTDTSRTYGEGIHVIFPWDRMLVFDGRLQLIEQELDVLSSDGLKMVVDVAYRFELEPKEIPDLAKYVGQDYQKIMVAPEVASHARDVFSRNTPEEIFSERREEIEKTMTDGVQSDLDKRFNPPWRHGEETHFVKVWDVLIRGITLPSAVAAAIERKNEAKQNNEAYDYRLLSEAKEAERKQIEAHGIKEFQDIVAPGLTDNYLRWQGIQATQMLANSHNSKIVVIGGGKGGLPIILGGLDGDKAATVNMPAPEGAAEKPRDVRSPPAASATATGEQGSPAGTAKPAAATSAAQAAPKATTPAANTPAASTPAKTAAPATKAPESAPATH